MNDPISMRITLLLTLNIDTRGQIFISITMLLMSIYLVDAYIREGKELKKMREEDDAERERERARKDSGDHLRKV
ncbi:MAG TPA: hypothetical protein VNS58_02470 [Puia sp.]|nr:hypothetical protein [Puia sp.]